MIHRPKYNSATPILGDRRTSVQLLSHKNNNLSWGRLAKGKLMYVYYIRITINKGLISSPR